MSAKVIDAKDFMDCVIDRIAKSVDESGQPVVIIECSYLGQYWIAAGENEQQARVGIVNQVADAAGAVVVSLLTAAGYIGVNQKAVKARYLRKLRQQAEKVVIDAMLYARDVDSVVLADSGIAVSVSNLISRLHGLIAAADAGNELRARSYSELVAEQALRLRSDVDAYRDRWDALMRRNVEDSQAVSPVQGEMPL